MNPEVLGNYIGMGFVVFLTLWFVWFIYKYKPVSTFINRSDKALTWILASFDIANSGGASARKLSSAWAILILATPPQIVWLVWAYLHGDFSLLPTVLTLDFGYSATALGMTTYSNIQEKKINSGTTKDDSK